MAIKDLFDRKTTPKKFAQDVIMDFIAQAQGYWYEGPFRDRSEEMTPREHAQVEEQLKKQADRVAKLFGYPESWSG